MPRSIQFEFMSLNFAANRTTIGYLLFGLHRLQVMSINIPINSMSVSEKLEAIALIWGSLAQDPDSVPSPEWHAEELADRAKRLETGETTVSDWDDAEKRFDELGS